MDAKMFAEELLKRDSRVRYIGIVDRQYNVLVSQMREGVTSVTPAGTDRRIIQLMPPLLLDAVEKLWAQVLGAVELVTVRYEKMLLVFFSKGNCVVVLSFNPDVTTPFMSALTDFIQSLSSQYLTD